MEKENVGYGATTASHEPGTEHERPEPDEQKEAAGQRVPGKAGGPDQQGENDDDGVDAASPGSRGQTRPR
jgi:hypothetical protein